MGAGFTTTVCKTTHLATKYLASRTTRFCYQYTLVGRSDWKGMRLGASLLFFRMSLRSDDHIRHKTFIRVVGIRTGLLAIVGSMTKGTFHVDRVYTKAMAFPTPRKQKHANGIRLRACCFWGVPLSFPSLSSLEGSKSSLPPTVVFRFPIHCTLR